MVWASKPKKPYGFIGFWSSNLHFCCTVPIKLICRLEKPIKPYGFIGFWSSSLHFCCTVPKKHRLLGLGVRKACLSQPGPWWLELIWSILLYQSFKKSSFWRLGRAWSIFIDWSFKKSLLWRLVLVWSIFLYWSFERSSFGGWGYFEALSFSNLLRKTHF